MENLKILVTRKMLPQDIDYICAGLDKEVKGKYEFLIPEDYSEDTLLSLVPEADVFMGPFVTEKMLRCAGKLKLIQVPWTGMDTFDFSAVRDFDFPVCNTHSNAGAVVELGVALILDLLKKVSYHDRKMRSGNWNRDNSPLSLKSRMLSDSRVCILGCGNIGYGMAKILSAFGAQVVAVDEKRQKDSAVPEVYPPEKAGDAVENADLVVCCLPLTDKTKGMINGSFIEKMKDGAMLVNMSRAGIIDEDALYEGLKGGKIAGFAADVWWNAPKRGESASFPSPKYDFQSFPNVVMSPHRAGFVENSFPHLDGAVENIINLICGRELLCRVDTKKQY